MALIVVADHGRHSREYVADQLRQAGHDVVVATDGRTALELIRQRRPELVITEVFLPGMDGYELVHQLRHDATLAATPVIFHTVAYHAHEVRTLAQACGVAHVILKASQPEQMIQAVEAALERGRNLDSHLDEGRLHQLETANRRLCALGALSVQLAIEGEPLRLLHNFCNAARAIIGARVAALGVLDDTGQALAHFLSSGIDAPLAFQLATLSPVRGVLGRLIREHRPIRFRPAGGASSDFPPPHPEVDSFLGVPVATANCVYGWLYLVGRYGAGEFDADDEHIAVTLAAQIAFICENIRVQESAKRQAARLKREARRGRKQEKDLSRLRRELAEADNRRDQLLGMLAHELRNPLAPMGNALRLLQVAPADSPTAERARGILERQYAHLTRLVNDLLEVSRLTRGKIQLRPARLDLGRLVRNSAEDHRGLIEAKGLSLHLELPPLPIWVDGDATRLAQVLDHLLQNAVRFTDQGGRIEVVAEPARDQAVVRIRDTGVGIDRELLPRVFESFIQADRSLDRSQGGLGLGLALVKALIQLHGGDVWAVSPGPGRGTEFGFQLPLREPAAPVPEVPVGGQDPGHGRVLIVEDNPDTAATLRMLLELSGYEVAVAGTGPEGVESALRLRPDVILCDIGLPGGMDGYAVARTVRQNPEMARTRLIAVTGYGRDEDLRRCREAGFDLHFTKPVDPKELTTRLLAEAPH